MIFTFQFLGALLLDLLFGDPRFLPHPVRGIGWLCNRFEVASRKAFRSEITAGAAAFLLVIFSTLAIPGFLLLALHQLSPMVETFCALLLLYTSIACRDLYSHSIRVYRALQDKDDIQLARLEVAQIVGRDTSALDKQGVCRACVETVAENLVDGVIAPLFFAILVSLFPVSVSLAPLSLAALGAYLYKAINTMDSMYGYKNEQYLFFGRVAAYVDDAANFIPARISGLLLICSAWLLRLDAKAGLKIFMRDRLHHASPNGGHPEAAVAGSLGVQLGGNSIYFGKTVVKPTLGDNLRPLEPQDIVTTNHLMFVTTLLFCIIVLITRLLLVGI